MKHIICLSNEPWSKLPGRTQQLVSRLKGVQILYFSPARRWNDTSCRQKGIQVRPNVTAYTLPPLLLPFSEHRGQVLRYQRRKLASFVAKCAQRHGLQSPLLWTTRPDHVHYLDLLNYDGLVYDCDREWDDFPPQWEGALAHAADVVFAASPLLADRLSPCSCNIVCVPNGLNMPLFSPDRPRPDPLPQVRGPLIGWAGTVRPDLDLSPIYHAAIQRPDWTFLLLGPRHKHPLLPRLGKLPNLQIPGPCPVSDVPDWLFRCDVLVDLLQEDRPNDDVVSPRLYEYMATGKPIVSMLWPGQVEQFPDVVYAAYDQRSFLHLIGSALEEAPGFVSQRRRDHASAAAWPLRTQQVSRILATAGLI